MSPARATVDERSLLLRLRARQHPRQIRASHAALIIHAACGLSWAVGENLRQGPGGYFTKRLNEATATPACSIETVRSAEAIDEEWSGCGLSTLTDMTDALSAFAPFCPW